MANVHVFDSLVGYSGDVDHTPILVGTAYIVLGGVDGYKIVGARMAPSAQVIGAYAYCWGRNPHQLLAVKACPTLEGGVWNDVLFDTPVDVSEFPGGRYYVVGFYLPNGNYLLKGAVFAGVNVPSPSDPNVLAAETSDSASTGGLPGNGVFVGGVQSDPTNPPAAPVWSTFNSNHYGVDAIIEHSCPCDYWHGTDWQRALMLARDVDRGSNYYLRSAVEACGRRHLGCDGRDIHASGC
jgi:hypothetical protein